ncbi:hypothetical protein DQ04_00171060 [Trypanosoma grayi]|uniref:hypothetical protein n=1 Tax=Trypanosoma grayi TaxID=71804 RepID=UPI0004F3F1E7|nr:hypothetical protein DQ04_00171060 [Trypanosoma grayi]KEG15142.1 hypothetical protein DQ04_00171060 [Trypanosoma grayi]
MSRAGASLLLRNLHCSLPAIARLYKEAGETAATGAAHSHRYEASHNELPLDVSLVADGEAVLDFFCRELNMGASALRRWRSGLAKAAHRRWRLGNDSHQKDTMQSVWPVNEDDLLFVQSAMEDLKAVVSPFLTLSQPQSKSAVRGITFVATQRILPGVFLLSLPVAAIFFAQPPPSNDPLTSFFMHVEELVGQLVAAGDGVNPDGWHPSHAGYVDYLKKSVAPSNNLPFLELGEINRLVSDAKMAKMMLPQKKKINTEVLEGNNNISSPAIHLWNYFHRDMGGLPLSSYLCERLSRDEYLWWVSLVLSRRAGAATLIPVVDKLNHHPEPNCYYTMATEESFCGIDVFDNLLAGVPSELLYEPFLHTFSIREIQKGEELTLCYASPTINPNQRLPGGGGMSVTSGEGRAAWLLQWGFIPERDSPYSSSDLQEVASIVAERRVDLRQEQFPPEK